MADDKPSGDKLPGTGANPLMFMGYPGPSTPSRHRLPTPIPECPGCSVKFNHLHCKSCFMFWCPTCKIIFRPDTHVAYNIVSHSGDRIGAAPDDVRIVTDVERSAGNLDGEPYTPDGGPGPCAQVIDGITRCIDLKCKEGGIPWRMHFHRAAA